MSTVNDATAAAKKRPAAITAHFNQSGEWNALNAALEWCKTRGISYGVGGHAAFPLALMVGDHPDIGPWTTLRAAEIEGLHGIMLGTRRTGPLEIRIFEGAPEIGR